MKKFFRRLIPFMSLLCLPVFGAFSPGYTHAARHPDETKRVVNTKESMYMPALITRTYEIETFEILNSIADFDFLSPDYRFYTQLSNFRPGSVINVTLKGRSGTNGTIVIGALRIGGSPENYRNEGNSKGRYWFDVATRRVHDHYGRNFGVPFSHAQYLAWIKRDVEVVVVGEPVPEVKANPRGW